jgi:transposase/uncharacterized coiled-coil protein SlyX
VAGVDPRIAASERRIAQLEAIVVTQADLLDAQAATIESQAAMIKSQAATIDRLERRVTELQRDASRHSGNSSKPPSADNAEQRAAAAAKRKAKRVKGQRRAGKQPGAPGANLGRVADPDHTVVHSPTCCDSCGDGLADAPVTGAESRQVFDLPERRAEVTDHVAERRRCGCGHETAAEFPPEATAPACWGPRVRAMAVCLLVRHHIPVARVAEILADLLGAPVSTGWVAGLTAQAADGLEPWVADLCDRLAAERVVHADETGARVSGVKWWFHVACTAMLTFIAVHRRRGVVATDEFGIFPRYRGTMIHDRWAPYWRYTKARHAICNAHILRDLAGVAEIASQKPWADQMAELLIEAKRRCDAARDQGRAVLPRGQRQKLRARYDAIVADALAANPDPAEGRKRDTLQKASYNLAVALRDHAAEVLRFTADLAVSFDNNQAERDLRMAKLQMKVSGCFRTSEGAERFGHVRSYIETARKHGLNPLDVLIELFNGNPWTIPSSAAGT